MSYSCKHSDSIISLSPIFWIWFTPSLPDTPHTKFWHELHLKQHKQRHSIRKVTNLNNTNRRTQPELENQLYETNVKRMGLTVAPANRGANKALKSPWTCMVEVKDEKKKKKKKHTQPVSMIYGKQKFIITGILWIWCNGRECRNRSPDVYSQAFVNIWTWNWSMNAAIVKTS